MQRTLKKQAVRRFCRPMGRSPGLALDTTAAGALEESWVSDSNLAAPSPPTVGKSQIFTRSLLQERPCEDEGA